MDPLNRRVETAAEGSRETPQLAAGVLSGTLQLWYCVSRHSDAAYWNSLLGSLT